MVAGWTPAAWLEISGDPFSWASMLLGSGEDGNTLEICSLSIERDHLKSHPRDFERSCQHFYPWTQSKSGFYEPHRTTESQWMGPEIISTSGGEEDFECHPVPT